MAHEDGSKPAERLLTRREALRALGAGAAALAMAACGVTTGSPGQVGSAGSTSQPGGKKGGAKPKGTPTTIISKKAAAGRKTNITLFSVFSGDIQKGWIQLAQKYEGVQKDVGVQIIYSPAGSSENNPKLLASIAGGKPPDLAHMSPFNTAQWVELGIMSDLTKYVQRDGIKGEDFWPISWEQMNYKGKVWQVQWDADPNFPLFWNQDLFEKVGLDPDKPPKTIDEVDEYSKKINQTKKGKVTRIGMIPWDTYGPSNSLFTWGWAFGGDFYDPKKQEVTPDNDYVVRALEWMVNYAKDVGGPDKVSVAPPNLQLHPFGTGNIGMAPLVTQNYIEITQAKPNMKIGHGLLPYEGPGATKPGQGAWLGGWAVFIPTGAPNPDAAWDFIKWFSATDEGTKAEWDTVKFIPCYKKASVFNEIKKDPVMKAYYDVIVTTSHARPNIPVGAFYYAQLDTQVSNAVYGKATPIQAMRTAKQNTMKEWRRFEQQHG